MAIGTAMFLDQALTQGDFRILQEWPCDPAFGQKR